MSPLFRPIAEPIVSRPWTIDGTFEDDGKGLSGITIEHGGKARRRGYAISDEGHRLLPFTLDIGKRRITVDRPSVTVVDHGLEADLEGGAFADGFFYFTGSHGLPQKKKKPREDSRYLVHRLPQDAEGSEAVRSSSVLARVIEGLALLAPYTEARPDKNGVNIEGLAVRDGVASFGFRSPVVDGSAIVLSLPVAALFENQHAEPVLQLLALGDGRGIRELAAVSDGVLVLAGPVGDEGGGFTLLHWHASGHLRRLGDFDALPEGARVEGMTVVDETGEAYELLVAFDGPPTGESLPSFLVPRLP